VGGEVLDDADVAHARGERADALGRHEEDVAELAVQDAGAQLAQRRVAALDVADGAEDVVLGADVDDRARLVDGRGQWLLDQDRDARAASSRTAGRCSSVGTATTAKSGAPPGAASSCAIVAWTAAGRRRRRSGRRRGPRRRRSASPGWTGGCARGGGPSCQAITAPREGHGLPRAH